MTFSLWYDRNDIWGDIHELRATIIDLADGIRVLSECCESNAIEHFFEAMVKQDSSQIKETFKTLLNSTIRSIKSFLFSFFNYGTNDNSNISKIVREKFPDFCVKHIVDFAGPESEKIENHPK